MSRVNGPQRGLRHGHVSCWKPGAGTCYANETLFIPKRIIRKKQRPCQLNTVKNQALSVFSASLDKRKAGTL